MTVFTVSSHVYPLSSFLSLCSGDGGNDVSMIQAADCGIGIEGKVRYFLL